MHTQIFTWVGKSVANQKNCPQASNKPSKKPPTTLHPSEIYPPPCSKSLKAVPADTTPYRHDNWYSHSPAVTSLLLLCASEAWEKYQNVGDWWSSEQLVWLGDRKTLDNRRTTTRGEDWSVRTVIPAFPTSDWWEEERGRLRYYSSQAWQLDKVASIWSCTGRTGPPYIYKHAQECISVKQR